MKRITVDEWKNVPAGTEVDTGFSGCYKTAPSEPGLYTLYELVTNNTHVGWRWEKEA